MRRFSEWFLTALVILLLMPYVAAAQSGGGDIRGRKTKVNHYRQIGGSCIYGRYGKLAYAPRGVDCPKKQDPGADGEVERVSSQLESELDGYRQEHEEMNEALAKLRESISDREYKQATKLLDRLRSTILSHKRREEQLFNRINAVPPASPDRTSNETALE